MKIGINYIQPIRAMYKVKLNLVAPNSPQTEGNDWAYWTLWFVNVWYEHFLWQFSSGYSEQLGNA